jgi:hypothetical protein
LKYSMKSINPLSMNMRNRIIISIKPCHKSKALAVSSPCHIQHINLFQACPLFPRPFFALHRLLCPQAAKHFPCTVLTGNSCPAAGGLILLRIAAGVAFIID